MHVSMNKSFLFTTSDSSKLSQQTLSILIHFYGRFVSFVIPSWFKTKIKENNRIRAEQSKYVLLQTLNNMKIGSI